MNIFKNFVWMSTQKSSIFFLEQHDTTLKSLIASGGLTEEKIMKCGHHLAQGLLFLFENKIAHLDIKTDNLMIS